MGFIIFSRSSPLYFHPGCFIYFFLFFLLELFPPGIFYFKREVFLAGVGPGWVVGVAWGLGRARVGLGGRSGWWGWLGGWAGGCCRGLAGAHWAAGLGRRAGLWG